MRPNLDLDFATFLAAVSEHTPSDLGRNLDTGLLGDDLLRFLFFRYPWIITGAMWRKASLLHSRPTTCGRHPVACASRRPGLLLIQ
jgi:hypothetical protein